MASLFMLMGIFMKEIGLMIRLMALGFIFTSMEPVMKAHGETTYSMDKVKKLGLMVLFMKGNIKWERSMGMECIIGMMAQDTKENGWKIRLKDLALILG